MKHSHDIWSDKYFAFILNGYILGVSAESANCHIILMGRQIVLSKAKKYEKKIKNRQ